MTDKKTVTTQSIQAILDSSPFIHFLGLTCEDLDAAAGTLVLKMPMRPELERLPNSGQYHGGPIASLIDTVGAFVLVMQTNTPVPTINFRVDYLRPATGGHLLGKALIRRSGRTVGVVDVDVTDEQGRLIAVGRGCFGVSAS